ncbi:hypothetical protein ACE1OC_41070 [Streptomyces sp. DSM 116496]|uniref:hypothetical protein n=1 Tax=Streptomyces stoeckheimensis TaxID=3344656 RepID=UPI0038B3134F
MWPTYEDHVTTWPGSAGTVVQPDQLADADADTDTDIEIVIGLAVPHITHITFREEDGTGAAWFYSRNDRSWAGVRWPEEGGPGTVYQYGPQRLWDAVEAACSWWEEQGRPGLDCFGLTVTQR